jgi:predicted transcriptional regulator
MAKTNNDPKDLKTPQNLVSKRLLGTLEAEVMQYMWEVKVAPVQRVVQVFNSRRPVAYTTIMTVMGHLVDKELLTRTADGKRYIYQVAQSQEEFLLKASQNMVRSVLSDFGDLAIAGFMGEISRVNPERLEELRGLLQEAMNEETISE